MKIRIQINDNVRYKEITQLYKEMESSKGKFKAKDIFHYNLRTEEKEKKALKKCILVTARLDGGLIGVAKIITDSEYIYYIFDVMVSPRHQGTGVGSKLMEAAIEFAKQNGFIKIFLTAIPGKEEYYERFGFKPTMSPVMALRGEDFIR